MTAKTRPVGSSLAARMLDLVSYNALAPLLVALAAVIIVRFGEVVLKTSSAAVSHGGGFRPTAWENIHPLPALVGPWSPNKALSNASLLTWGGAALGPESIAADDRDSSAIYASLEGGVVLRLSMQNLSDPGTPVFFAPAAASGWASSPAEHPAYGFCMAQAKLRNFDAEETCGRPLGLRVYNGTLYVADAHFGVFRVKLPTPAAPAAPVAKWIAPPWAVFPATRFVNDLDVDGTDGSVFFTDSDHARPRRENRLTTLENAPRGRLLRAVPPPPAGGPWRTEVLMDDLHFPNGVCLLRPASAALAAPASRAAPPQRAAVLVAELSRLRVLRCELPLLPPAGADRGSGAGATASRCSALTVFADRLPCLPDNIRQLSDGTVAVACFTKVAAPFSLPYTMWRGERTARVIHVMLSAAPWLTRRAEKSVQYGLVLLFAQDGTPIGSLHDPSGRVPGISQATEVGGDLLLGSSFNPFIARVNMQEARSQAFEKQ